MMNIDRYTLEEAGEEESPCTEEGDWVKYEDHEARMLDMADKLKEAILSELVSAINEVETTVHKMDPDEL